MGYDSPANPPSILPPGVGGTIGARSGFNLYVAARDGGSCGLRQTANNNELLLIWILPFALPFRRKIRRRARHSDKDRSARAKGQEP